MASTRSYSKGIAKREEILTTALDVIAHNGYSGATLRELAEAVGLSQMGVLHYFGTKEALFTEVLKRRDEVDIAAFGRPHEETNPVDDFPAAFTELIRHNTEVPGLVQLYTNHSTEAAETTHPSHEFFRDRFAKLRTTLGDGIREAQKQGRIDAGLDPERLAVIMSALADGLQTQWMYDPSVDMADHVAYLWEILGRTTPRD